MDSNLLWQSIVAHSLTLAAMNSVMAMESWADNDLKKASELLAVAANSLGQAIIQGPKLAEQRHFKGWLEGDRYMNIRHLRDSLQEHSTQLEQAESRIA